MKIAIWLAYFAKCAHAIAEAIAVAGKNWPDPIEETKDEKPKK